MRRALCFQVAPYSLHCAQSSARTLRAEITCRYSYNELECAHWSAPSGAAGQEAKIKHVSRRGPEEGILHRTTTNGRNWERLTFKWKSDTVCEMNAVCRIKFSFTYRNDSLALWENTMLINLVSESNAHQRIKVIKSTKIEVSHTKNRDLIWCFFYYI